MFVYKISLYVKKCYKKQECKSYEILFLKEKAMFCQCCKFFTCQAFWRVCSVSNR